MGRFPSKDIGKLALDALVANDHGESDGFRHEGQRRGALTHSVVSCHEVCLMS